MSPPATWGSCRCSSTCACGGDLVVGHGWGPGIIGAPKSHELKVPSGMSSPTQCHTHCWGPQSSLGHPPRTRLELADAALQLGVTASRAPAPIHIHVGTASSLLGLPVLPVGVEQALLRQP